SSAIQVDDPTSQTALRRRRQMCIRDRPPASPRGWASPTPSATPSPSVKPVVYPAYRPPARRTQPRHGPSLVSLTLLITAPAVLAVAALRPR
ncbi:hypothetical protein, partial [Streptomyces albidoflavus]|uniref:hypothetical protein n=1 Tax=Streptomyces albidoflavus TaxID=1886 RepID=UPI001C536D01